MILSRKETCPVSSDARDRILGSLRSALHVAPGDVPGVTRLPRRELKDWEKVQLFSKILKEAGAKIIEVDAARWTDTLKEQLRERDRKALVYTPHNRVGREVAEAWRDNDLSLPELIPHDTPMESFKDALFDADSSVTGVFCALAETGTLVFWSSPEEPRSTSLVPILHIAIVRKDQIYADLREAMETHNWVEKMPAAVTLVSGPSKTADIEGTLAFGIHGPMELIVLIVG